jgi:hypothetical protein
MELAQVRHSRPASSEKPVPDMLTRVRIAFHAVTFDQVNAFLSGLTERVLSIRAHFEHSTFEQIHCVIAVMR